MDTDGNPGGPNESRSREGKSLNGWPAQSIFSSRPDDRGPSLFTGDDQPLDDPEANPVAVIGGLADAVASDGPVPGRVSILQHDSIDDSPPLTWGPAATPEDGSESDEPVVHRPGLAHETEDPAPDQGPVSIMESRVVDPAAGLSTGQLPFRQARMPLFGLAQLGILIGAAVVVGALVYLGVTSTVGGSSDDEAQADLEPDPTAIEPGPGDPSGPLGSKRTTVDGEMATNDPDPVTAEDGQGPADDALAGRPQPPDGDTSAGDDQDSNATGGDTGTGTDTASSDDSPSASPNPANEAASTGDDNSGVGSPPSDRPMSTTPSTTSSAPTTRSSTTQLATTQTTTGPAVATKPPTTTTTRPPPTQPPTTQPPTTQPPTTRPPTTQVTGDNIRLVRAPSEGAVVNWESPLRVELNAIPGATRYCVTLEARGSSRRCSGEPALRFPGSRRQIGPGSAAIVATAIGEGGVVLREERVELMLRASDVIAEPDEGARVAVDRRIRLVAQNLPAVDEFCWRFVQGSKTTDAFCGGRRTLVISRAEAAERLAGFEPGDAMLWVVASRGGVVVGQDMSPIVLTGNFDDLESDLAFGLDEDSNLSPMVLQGMAELGDETDSETVDDFGMVSEMMGDSADQSPNP